MSKSTTATPITKDNAIHVYREIAEVLKTYGYVCAMFGDALMLGMGNRVELLCMPQRPYCPPPSMVLTNLEAREWMIADVHDNGYTVKAIMRSSSERIEVELCFIKDVGNDER